MERPRRPVGITIIAILAILGGALSLLGGLLAFAAGSVLALLPPEAAAEGGPSPFALAMMSFGLGLLVLLNAALGLGFGVGAWRLRPWAWTLGIVTYGLNMVIGVAQLLMGAEQLAPVLVGMAVGACILAYMATPQARRAFARA